jgi:DNA-binding MarR family transcriptional regulator
LALIGAPLPDEAGCETGPVPPAPPPDPELLARLSLSVTRLSRMLRQQDEVTRAPAAAAALATIVRDGPISLGDLAAAEQVSPSTITKIVSRLEGDGSIERVIDPADRRVHRVRLSEQGRLHIAKHRSRRNSWLADQLQALGATDVARLEEVVELLERLTASEGADPVTRAPRA